MLFCFLNFLLPEPKPKPKQAGGKNRQRQINDRFKGRSHPDGKSILCVVAVAVMNGFNIHSPFMTAMATEKMGIMEWSDGVGTVATTTMEKLSFLVLSVAVAVEV